jgi:CBS domain containing-hemolysin-like protein
VTTVLVLVFGEIVPKSYGLGHAKSWRLRVARPIQWIEWLLTPLIVIFDTGTSWLAGFVGGDQVIEHAYQSD